MGLFTDRFGHKEHELKFNDEFWKNTKYKVQNGNTYDSVEDLTATHLANQNEFFKDLQIPLKNQDTPAKGIPSKIDPTLMVTDKQWVVSLVRKSIHAYIVVESIGFGKDEGLCMRWFDYLPKKRVHADAICWGAFHNPQAFILNFAVPAMVRYCPTNDGAPLSNIPDSVTREELFTKLNWHAESSSCVVPRLKVKAMFKDIEYDFKRSDKGTLLFRKRSDFRLNSHHIPNCTTWAWAKLKVAGVNAENESMMNHIVVDASHNIGPDHKLTYSKELAQENSIKHRR